MDKLIISISPETLFDIQSDNTIFDTGPGLSLIRKFLEINKLYPEYEFIKILITGNKSLDYQKLLNSMDRYKLFSSCEILPAGLNINVQKLDIDLHLSMNQEEVRQLIQHGQGAGVLLPSPVITTKDAEDTEFRFAFDFDGVIADDESEIVFETNGKSYEAFFEHEAKYAHKILQPGPIAPFFKKVASFKEYDYRNKIRISIITSRKLKTIERPLNTLKSWDIKIDDIFVMNGQEKSGVLKNLKPHLYMDDQLKHLGGQIRDVCFIHIPFGIKNKELSQ